MMEATLAPPQVRAAMYRALALIPNTHVVPAPMKDARGREGIAIRYGTTDDPRLSDYVIFDAHTYTCLGRQENWHGADYFRNSFAVRAGVVDNPGQVPGGPVPRVSVSP